MGCGWISKEAVVQSHAQSHALPAERGPAASALVPALNFTAEERESEAGQSEEGETSGELQVVLGELFQYGDFVVSVPKEKPKKLAKPAFQKTRKPTKKVEAKEEGGMFQFGDFCIAMESVLDDAIVQAAAAPGRSVSRLDELLHIRRLEERRIRHYDQYTLLGHASRVKCTTLTPSENHYVSCAHEDTAIVMYDIYTGREVLSFFGHEDTVISACFSLDSKFLATTSRDNTMILWDAVIGQQVSVFDHEKVVLCCCFSRDGKYVVSGCQDKICRKWDIRKRREVLAYTEHEGIIVAVSYAPDGECICSAAADKTLRIWSATTGQTLRVLRGHRGIVLACTYSQDGRSVVSNDESIVHVWDVEIGLCTRMFEVNSVQPLGKKCSMRKLAWTLSTYAPGLFGFYIVAVCNDRAVYIFHPETGEEVVSFQTKAPVYCLSCGLTAKMAFGDSYGNIYVVVLS
eukprot:EG_transcript_2331